MRLSRLMAYLLRHDPSLPKGENGFVELDALLKSIRERNLEATLEDITEVVEKDEKGRYEIMGDKIRARYGHTVDVVLEYPEGGEDILYHGTAPEVVGRILREGLKPMGRRMVHLSATPRDAIEVGKRRSSKPVVLRIDARKARERGIKILKASEKVYLARSIPPECISLEGEHESRKRVFRVPTEAGRSDYSVGYERSRTPKKA